MLFTDRLTLDKAPRRNGDGYMGIHARAARTGVYQYLGREIDPDGSHFAADQVVNVYRPPEEVFNKASLGSFVAKPITDDHPEEAVNSTNWRDLARGTIMRAKREVADDGEYVGFDLAFLDSEIIDKIESGKSELSNGYDADLEIEDGTAPDGTKYQAIQRDIRGNHIALVDAGRAGSKCRVGDSIKCGPIPSDEVRKLLIDQRTYDAARDGGKKTHDNAQNGDRPVPKIILVDGHQIDISNADVAEATINTLIGRVTAADKRADTAEASLATVTTEKATLDAKVVTLEKQIEDNKITPKMLADAAKTFADVKGKAKAVGVEVTDEMGEAEIKAAVVDAKLGDLAKGWTPAQIDVSFLALTVDAEPDEDETDMPKGKTKTTDKLNEGMRGGIRPLTDAKGAISTARQGFLNRKESAYLGAQQ